MLCYSILDLNINSIILNQWQRLAANKISVLGPRKAISIIISKRKFPLLKTLFIMLPYSRLYFSSRCFPSLRVCFMRLLFVWFFPFFFVIGPPFRFMPLWPLDSLLLLIWTLKTSTCWKKKNWQRNNATEATLHPSCQDFITWKR